MKVSTRFQILSLPLRMSLISLALLSAGCGNVSYLWQTAKGHWEILRAAQPVPQWLADPDTPQALKERLALTQRMRDWAVSALKLPDNGSYRRYADLHRSAVLWNVVATPEFSLTLKTWCFPVTGCIGYRGYYAEQDAQRFAQDLAIDAQAQEPLDTAVYGVPAYSTLGWFDDPLLNTFIQYPEGELARMIFHELAHQVAYAKDDTVFNESFATAVERLGAQRWLAERSTPEAQEEFAKINARRQDFKDLTTQTRQQLQALYADSSMPLAQKRQAKAQRFAAMRARYETLKTQPNFNNFNGYDAWFARANNASLAVLGAYNDRVAEFEHLFEREGQDFTRFYAAVKDLARQPAAQRHTALDVLDAFSSTK